MLFATIAALTAPIYMSGCAETGHEYAESSESVEKAVGETALMTAAKAMDLKQIQILLSGSASPNQVDAAGSAALHYLFDVTDTEIDEESRKEIASLLLSKGADPAIRNKFGVSALALAAQNAPVDTLRQLLKYTKKLDLSPDISGDTLLHMAALGGSGENVRLVLDEIPGGKALLNKRNNDGETPLFSAAGANVSEGGGTIDASESWPGIENRRLLRGGNQAFRELLKSGAEFDLTNKAGMTMLAKLISERDQSNMVQLLKKGGSPNQPDIDGIYPLQQAISRCDGVGALILIQAGANSNATGSIGLTAPELAKIKAEICEDDAEKLLLKKIAVKYGHKR